MTLIMPALFLAFAAFGVWLTVRIINRRERWAKWTLVATLLLPTLYALAPGPLIWWAFHNGDPELIDGLFKSAVFQPGIRVLDAMPEPVETAYSWYLDLWYPEQFP